MMAGLVVATALMVASTGCWAGSANALFSVEVILSSASGGALPPGICISQTLSEKTNATVQVACNSGQFVSIAPRPGSRFIGTHGGAYRYKLDAGRFHGLIPSGEPFPFAGNGTITALRIYNTDGNDGPLELLVSF